MHCWLVCLLAGASITQVAAAAANVLFDMDLIQHYPGESLTAQKEKVPVGSIESVPGKFGRAVHFCFTNAAPGFMTASIPAGADLSRCEGFSFYVRGDGSTNWGGLELIDRNDYSKRYGYCFPIESTEWQKITVPWHELTPELASPLMDAQHGYAPSGFGSLWFGKWFYWRGFPAHSYAIDQVVLEEKVPAASTAELKFEPGLRRVQASLKAGRPITIVTMGDSLTDERHWSNAKTVWSKLLAQRLQEHFHSEITLVNPAIGGTTLSQNLVLLPRWAQQVRRPDLVTIWFGYNDWDSGVRGSRFKEYLGLAVDRIRLATQVSADILLLSTSPAFERWDSMRELEQAAREVAQEKQVGFADVAAEFRQAGSAERALAQGYWGSDKTHLGAKGHELVAGAVFQLLQ